MKTVSACRFMRSPRRAGIAPRTATVGTGAEIQRPRHPVERRPLVSVPASHDDDPGTQAVRAAQAVDHRVKKTARRDSGFGKGSSSLPDGLFVRAAEHQQSVLLADMKAAIAQGLLPPGKCRSTVFLSMNRLRGPTRNVIVISSFGNALFSGILFLVPRKSG